MWGLTQVIPLGPVVSFVTARQATKMCSLCMDRTDLETRWPSAPDQYPSPSLDIIPVALPMLAQRQGLRGHLKQVPTSLRKSTREGNDDQQTQQQLVHVSSLRSLCAESRLLSWRVCSTSTFYGLQSVCHG